VAVADGHSDLGRPVVDVAVAVVVLGEEAAIRHADELAVPLREFVASRTSTPGN
jgi:hypothetical protein